VRILSPITSTPTDPVDGRALVDRVRLSCVSLGYALTAVAALPLAIVTVLAVPLGLVGVGFPLALAAVPATAALAGRHRRVSGALLAQEITAAYADTARRPVLSRPVRWLTDGARWRDVGFLWFAATGGFVLSAIPPLLLVAPVVYVVCFVFAPSWTLALLLVVGALDLLVWWLVTPSLVRVRATVERAILGRSDVAALERRVEHVTASRSDMLDHSAAEVRRIERDLHDGAQARMAAVGMTVGLAEKLVASDPDAAAALLAEARRTTVAALDDLRSVVRAIHPPVLADRGLAGAIEALAVPIPIPVTVSVTVPDRLPDPIESAAYFAVAECLANTVKHARAGHAHVTGSHDGTRLRLVVGDDGRGGADPTGSGLSGVARRLDAFDGRLTVDSPTGGPTVVTLEIPCPT
jgi:signal transduction histidine kinase